jgi:hypothetical protein
VRRAASPRQRNVSAPSSRCLGSNPSNDGLGDARRRRTPNPVPRSPFVSVGALSFVAAAIAVLWWYEWAGVHVRRCAHPEKWGGNDIARRLNLAPAPRVISPRTKSVAAK